MTRLAFMVLLTIIAVPVEAARWQCGVVVTVGKDRPVPKTLAVEITPDRTAIVSGGSVNWETGVLTRQGNALVYGDITPGETDERVVTTTMLRVDTETGDFVWIDNRERQQVFRGTCTREP